MKGVIDIEFILAAFLFLTTIVFITLSIIGKVPFLKEKSLSDNLQSASYQVSELLLDRGYPKNWETLPIDSVARIGLENDDHVLDTNKVTALKTLCLDPTTNYDKLREKFSGNDFTIKITGNAGPVPILDCEPPVVSVLRPKFITTRHAVYQGDIVDITVAILG